VASHTGRRDEPGPGVPPRLVAVFAHPDDETFLAGGTLSIYAARGWDVRLVCATRGEAGKRGPYVSLSTAEFGAVRAAELADACRALGIGPPRFLDCPDGGVSTRAAETGAAIADLLRTFDPRVVVTFGPDGISGHADHVAVHRVVTAAFEAWRWSDRQPGGAAAPGAARLYYVRRSAAVPSCCGSDGAPPPPPLTTAIDIAAVGRRKLAAARCHRSQGHLYPAGDAEAEAMLTSPEHFHRAVPAWPDRATAMETALWADEPATSPD
jgi:LmbE family N-acetylglucosaminyl deacetylase